MIIGRIIVGQLLSLKKVIVKRLARPKLFLLLLFIFADAGRADLQVTSRVFVNSVLNIVDLSAVVLHANRERLVVRPSFNATRQEAF